MSASNPVPFMRRFPASAVTTLLAFTAGMAAAHRHSVTVRSRTEAAARFAHEMAAAAFALGSTLPDVLLRDLDGQPVRLYDRIAGQTSLLVIVRARECLSCLNYPLELRILKHRLPGLAPLLVATGPDTLVLKRYLRDQRWRDAVLDPEGMLLHALNTSHTPIVALLDTHRRIVWIDVRPRILATAEPLGTLLPALVEAIQCTAERSAPTATAALSAGGSIAQGVFQPETRSCLWPTAPLSGGAAWRDSH
ncbi:MAG TPA: hypothetical protein VNL18_03510 [Gemmatimonadales bacterium]|nr:hypothetical protein [Gemmatimonadales bacterium]